MCATKSRFVWLLIGWRNGKRDSSQSHLSKCKTKLRLLEGHELLHNGTSMLSTVVIFLLSVYSLEGFWSVAKMVSNSKLCWLRSEFTEKAWENAVRGLGTLKPHDHPRRPESCPNVSDPLFQNEAKCKDATSKKLCLLENVIWDCNNFKSKTRDFTTYPRFEKEGFRKFQNLAYHDSLQKQSFSRSKRPLNYK